MSLMLLISTPAFGQSNVKILKVTAGKAGQYNEVSVYTSENIKPEIILLESPNRVALAFHNSTIDSPVTLPGPSPLIRIIQAMQFDENTVYVMVEPNEALSFEFASIIGRNKFILEFSRAKPGSKKTVMPSIVTTPEAGEVVTVEAIRVPPKDVEISAIEEPTVEAVSAPQKPVKISAKAAPSVEAAPAKATQEVKATKIPQFLAGVTIVIDPGHGGRDPGYVGKSGILEKFLNLKIAFKLKKFLADAGANVILTRERDISTKDKEIVNIANRNKADIFVALHLNSFISPRIAGCETYYFMPYSKRLAKIVQKNLSSTIKRRNRGIKKVTYYTIHHTKMPAILVEAAYLTNPKEEKLILNPNFQGTVAYGIYKGIKEYVKITPTWQKYR